MSVITETNSSSTSKYLRWNSTTQLGVLGSLDAGGSRSHAGGRISSFSHSGERTGVGILELNGLSTSLLWQLKFHSQSSLRSFVRSEDTTTGEWFMVNDGSSC